VFGMGTGVSLAPWTPTLAFLPRQPASSQAGTRYRSGRIAPQITFAFSLNVRLVHLARSLTICTTLHPGKKPRADAYGQIFNLLKLLRFSHLSARGNFFSRNAVQLYQNTAGEYRREKLCLVPRASAKGGLCPALVTRCERRT
jgi:hypothetical protein